MQNGINNNRTEVRLTSCRSPPTTNSIVGRRGEFGDVSSPLRGDKGTLLLARRRWRAVDGKRVVPLDGKEWCSGPAKTLLGGDHTSEELDTVMGASENDWWRRLGGKCGRHGDGDFDLMFFVWQ